MTRSFTKTPIQNRTSAISKSSRGNLNAMFKFDQNVIRPRRSAVWSVSNRFAGNQAANFESLNKNLEYEYAKQELADRERGPDLDEYKPVKLPVRSFQIPETIKERKLKKCNVSGKAIRRYFQDYCEGTSLHGLRYVGMDNVSFFERLFWIIAFISAIGFSAFFISNIYDKWNLTPMLVGINPEYKSVSDIPFPAITICNMNQAKKEEVEKIIANKYNDAEKFLLEDICNMKDKFVKSTESLENSTNWEFIKEFMLKVSQPCSELLVHCKWQGYSVPCKEILNSAITDEGVCCTFNRVASNFMYHRPLAVASFNITTPNDSVDWSPERGYPANSTNNTWPLRAIGSGANLGLSLITNVAPDSYYCSSTSSVGLKVILHSPVETPRMADYGFFIHPRKEVRIAIMPSLYEAFPSINKIPINKRQCYFSTEKQLFFYRTYTKMNCELECVSNFTLKQCDCVPFFLPKDSATPICDKSKEECHDKAKTDMNLYYNPATYCSCLPACNELSYNQHHSLGDLSNTQLLQTETNNTDIRSLIIMHFFYQQTQFRSFQKSELFGFTEFLSNSGGLLGLFTGFSFLSALEIGYHLTLRLWCVYYRKYQNHQNEKNDVIIIPYTR